MAEAVKLKVGENILLSKLIQRLVDFGYERVDLVELSGQFSVAGGTISIFLPTQKDPAKIDFFGSEIDQITTYSLESGLVISKERSIAISSTFLRLADGSKVSPGDYIVHENYGIGIFRRWQFRLLDGEEKRYIILEYLNGDILWVPENIIEKISSYVGVGKRHPRLSKLGSATWQKTYKKTYENVIKLARELLNLYAERSITSKKGWRFDTEWDKAIRQTFPFSETPDQAEALKNVYTDLASGIPMDRLIAGDVGFGKTEVAIRAATQAVSNGYQVVILVPTTILAEQHYATLLERFDQLPVTIARLSRFIPKLEQARIIEGIGTGKVDILIGTHRLLDDQIKYNNLGLYVIDEEQRFGVKQKEKLKKIRTEINVLTMSATPIPRTLFMSLSGLRDISQINTPPAGRREIATEISKYNEDLISQYLRREYDRGGQSYFLHNEVASIEGKRNYWQGKFPDWRFGVAHGQMPEEKLVEVMRAFTAREIDVLICSTIMENGLDLSNVNTLIVEAADHFGLSQLYQIRGRIGRSDRQAYSLFLHQVDKLTPNAVKRLKSLVENTELGSGFNIALSDLEIRGGGNVLGREQSGNMEAVGLVLYSKLLKMAVDKIRPKR